VILTHTREGNLPSLEGKKRLTKAISLYREGKIDRFLIGAGLPDCENKSLAQIYAEYLISEGIPSPKIFKEDRSRDTAETLRFVQEIVKSWFEEGFKILVFISNRYHLKRMKMVIHSMSGWQKFRIEFCSSHDNLRLWERIKEFIFRFYTKLDPLWESTLAEIMRKKRQHYYLKFNSRP